MKYRILFTILFFAVTVALPNYEASGQSGYGKNNLSKDQVIAGIILKIPLVVKWPKTEKGSAQNVKICMTEKNMVGEHINSMLASGYQNQNISFAGVVPENTLKSCNIVFISKGSTAHTKKLLDILKGHNVMTISNNRGFTSVGGIMEFFADERQIGLFSEQKVKFEISRKNADNEELTIDPLLLELAERVAQ